MVLFVTLVIYETIVGKRLQLLCSGRSKLYLLLELLINQFIAIHCLLLTLQQPKN